VHSGDVLVALDATVERIAATRARARVTELEPQVASIERELEAEDDARENATTAELDAEQELHARVRAAETELAFAEKERAREQASADNGVSPRAMRERAESEYDQRKAGLEAVRHQADALGAAHRERADSRRVRREQLERQNAELTSALGAAQSEASRLYHEVERRTITSPVNGVLGEVVALRPGAVVHAGDLVATVVPDGTLQIVAEYQPAAIGRIAVGQPAHLRLDAFPWTRYGTVAARVAGVGTEVRDGTIHVELAIVAGSLPVRHGMTGTTEIEIEHVSPVQLVLRAIGDRLSWTSP
jgi:membrane fusion protein (multidrug efflux system)